MRPMCELTLESIATEACFGKGATELGLVERGVHFLEVDELFRVHVGFSRKISKCPATVRYQ